MPPFTRLAYGSAAITDLQAWYVLHALRSKKQLLEVLTQFLDNHFVTLQSKSEEYLNGKAPAGGAEALSTDFEYRDLTKWRQVLMNPNGTFYDLLKISTESPAMVIYLDTVASKKGAANENYARELMELFTMGVDNGYDQKDIEEMSRAGPAGRWIVPAGQENNPFATPIASASRNTTPGYWTLRFNSPTTIHDTAAKTIFPARRSRLDLVLPTLEFPMNLDCRPAPERGGCKTATTSSLTGEPAVHPGIHRRQALPPLRPRAFRPWSV